jgi:hypothetical protein
MSESPDEMPKVVRPEGLGLPPRSYRPAEPKDTEPETDDSEDREPSADGARQDGTLLYEQLESPVAAPDPRPGSGNGQYRQSGRGQQVSWGSQRTADEQDDYGQQGARASAQAGFAAPPDTSSDLRICLWGSPQSGKTTFLAALRNAIATRDSRVGEWNVFPVTQDSSRFMSALTYELSQGRFPQGTQPGDEIKLRWLFVGDLTDSRFVPRRKRLFGGKVTSRFVLDLVDVSGRAFAHDPTAQGVPVHVAATTMDRLAQADGFLYLFDPIGERDNRDSYDFVNRVTTELRHRAVGAHSVAATPQHLRQQVSVCITKFDDPDVFQAARGAGLVTDGPDGMPRILDKDAEHFFDLLCTDRFWKTRYEASARSADQIRKELRSVFGAEKVQFFVTSSVGFYRGLGWQGRPGFDADDFVNVAMEANDEPRIRGPINPVNVLEPLISLQQRLGGWA